MNADAGSPAQDFAGLRAVVTGAASGIGRASAHLLARRGAVVVGLDIAPAVEGDGLVADRSVLLSACDLRDDAQVRTAVTAAARHLGGIDVLVNNAGIGAVGTVETHDDAEWARVFDVNLMGAVRVTRAALPHLRGSGAAAVVVVSSIAAWAGLPSRALYSASKGALQALALAMAADHVGEGIRVNAVAPGTTDTPWVSRLLHAADDPGAAGAALRARQPLGRLVTADEVAAAVAYLASPWSGSTTGTVLAVDGGMYGLRMPPSR